MRRLLGLAVVVATVGLLPGRAEAAFHLMKISEVFPGTTLAPNAQYVEIQMYAGLQNLVMGHPIMVYDSNDVQIGVFNFTANVANGANQATILIATPEALTLFALTPDLIMSASVFEVGGKVCFDTIDCVAWGSYSGSSVGVGTPAPALQLGRSLTRRLNIAGGANKLDAADDTGNSVNDFVFAVPSPRNNAGQNGTIPASTCQNSVLEGLEQCDDGNADDTDACSNMCLVQVPAGPIDAGVPDAPMLDADTTDADTTDADPLAPDADTTDADTTDASPIDADTTDAAPGVPDAAAPRDAIIIDTGDGGLPPPAGDDGCGCRTGGRPRHAALGVLGLLALLAWRARRRYRG